MLSEIISHLTQQATSSISLQKGEPLFRQGDPVRSIYIVRSGMIELTRPQQDGRTIVLQRATHRKVVAEASLYSESYHCDAIAAEATECAIFPKNNFETLLKEDDLLSRSWAEYLAKEVQHGRQMIEILSRKTVAERLNSWLVSHDETMIVKGHWKNVALNIGVSPEALYRELAKRRLK